MRRYDGISFQNIITSAMDSPTTQSAEISEVAIPPVINVSQCNNSLWGNVSQLSQLSSSCVTFPRLSLRPKDIGVPSSPDGCVLNPVNEGKIDQGYDSKGLLAPREEHEQSIFNDLGEDEPPFPFGPAASLTMEAIAKNIAKKMVTNEEVPKLLAVDLSKKSKRRGSGVNTVIRKSWLVV